MRAEETVDADRQSPGARVELDLGPRSYGIEIGTGLLNKAGELIIRDAGRANCTIVTDRIVAGHHLSELEDSLRRAGIYTGTVVIDSGEATKSFGSLASLCEELLSRGVERGDLVVAFGGGVIGDLVGFAASILRRGVRFVQIPTTLLAQVDSSVGGKTGINTPLGKNLIGTFYQPELVLADLDALTTLDPREFRAGYAEVVKYGLISDPEFFDWLEANRQAILDGDTGARAHAVETSCRAKAGIVAEDERESGRRALLNLGHTFGHALEAWAGYGGRLIHGEAVAIGMTLAHEYSCERGLCPGEDLERVRAHLTKAGLPTAIADIPGDDRPEPAQLLTTMYQDKKVKAGRLVFVLTHGIGKAFITADVAVPELENFLKRKCGDN